MLWQQWPQVLKWWWQWVLHSLSMRDQHWMWQQQRETMEEASLHQPDSFDTGPPWRWCPSSKPFWFIGPLVPGPSWITSPHNSWSALPVWGPGHIQAGPWPWWLLVITSGQGWSQALLWFVHLHLYWNGRRQWRLTVTKGGTNDAPLLSSPTESPWGMGKCLAYLPLFSWKDNLSWRIREQSVQMQQDKWDWVVKVPAERVVTSRWGELKDPHWRWGKLVKSFTTSTPGLGKSNWTKVESAFEGFTFAWSDLKKVVIIPSFPLPTLSITKIAKGVMSVLIVLLPMFVMKSAPAFSHSNEEVSGVKSLSNTMWKWIACR